MISRTPTARKQFAKIIFDPYDKYHMDLCNESCSAGQQKNLTLDITRKLFNQILSYL